MLLLAFSLTNLYSNEFSFRKYQHVKSFYSDISSDTIEVGLKHKIPPAAIMAIAGLESGYGSGYVAQITGNILSLGAFKGDRELPALYLPYSKSSKSILFDENKIKKRSKNDLLWKQRPKSLKRDYRPEQYAGSTRNLALLKYDKKLKEKACKACLNDFATRWIKSNSKVKVFRDARIWLDKEVSSKGLKVLFNEQTNKKFIEMIGGHPHSFNYRKTWPKKAKLIMSRAGLVKLSTDIYINKMSFNTAWRNK
ncbi:MAG: glucosaminidase domain-containing protein [Sulfurimonas sp.]|uniref:hypothetical protein n=1 Tax=Sulfurimonas sp. TaxID=2022749 RepID=UPI002624AE21|nr:hypothetical protein [Sulfurimonas sp.]MCW8895176.1 glucosaminidase domain-containing protein [Sulfurimonas sp.]MCW8954863.1 glucosaminidase domain-containing protein [Sulfurimonas sp.]MCW9068112.1 glucosaminidase domain-containing protein [Sulfurimonas sp.]